MNKFLKLLLSCCSNHSSLKDKWSHNEQSSPMGYQVKSGDYKRTRQGALAALLLYLYNLQVVCATTICLPHVYLPCFYLMSITHPHVFSIRPPCFLHVPWHHTFNLRCTCAHHVYTMRNPYSLTSSPNPNSISRLFPILLDPKSFQTALDSITWLPGHVLSFRCRLIIYYCPIPVH